MLYNIVSYVFQALYYLLIARVILSWIPHNPSHPIVQLLYTLTDPILEPFRKLLPSSSMGIDFSPIIAFIVLGLVQNLILGLLARLLG
ncbi:MAG: YggT family protein [Candidatus Margulisiibacteriota bacterium]|nr:MAG: hypothetical protein A2X43_07640 [Candidatus Margulisbacteria bacterium GWD2_39_127]OGI03905.1 MAG: hypothetical protein A2X42_10095 [Candidatus Margulisbacteria bacterium GWF2_38_17]OGI08790.1 MAG: hypothetical protein A2X41_05020 [Candidatus Margulisbacteria bacterium GWE2_39_32]PZM78622.1 MAG: YggT family protein [Candidatus Margulisiibacteriota bacterium]HAR61962.1 YggT family protein [Candidatus Margulisiibacteriota bacterium]